MKVLRDQVVLASGLTMAGATKFIRDRPEKDGFELEEEEYTDAMDIVVDINWLRREIQNLSSMNQLDTGAFEALMELTGVAQEMHLQNNVPQGPEDLSELLIIDEADPDAPGPREPSTIEE